MQLPLAGQWGELIARPWNVINPIISIFPGKWMTLAFFIESLMIAYIPAEYVAGLIGSGNAAAIPISALLGIPAYMNGYAAIPLWQQRGCLLGAGILIPDPADDIFFLIEKSSSFFRFLPP